MIEVTRGKIKVPILIVSLLVIAFFIFIIFVVRSPSNVSLTQPVSSSTEIIPGNNSSSTNATTTVATSSSVSNNLRPTTTPPIIISIQPVNMDGHAIGIAAGGGLSKISTSSLNQYLNRVVTLGATWVRFDIEWGDVQYSSSSSFTWSGYDDVVNALAAHHLHGLATILFTPMWARVPSCSNGVECPPANPAQYAAFAADVVARYKNTIQDYEIWNEPNNYDFWAPYTNCGAYTTLLKATYPAIKAVDPNAMVITGGLAPEATDAHNMSQLDFLSCIYANGGGPYFDAVADHPYSFPQTPSEQTQGAWGQMSETATSLRSIMIANGDANKKIWITEFGAPTNGPDPYWYVSEAAQAAMVTNAMSLYKTYSWAGPFFWYTLQDDGTSTSTNENFFGLIRADGSLKPAYSTLQTVVSEGL